MGKVGIGNILQLSVFFFIVFFLLFFPHNFSHQNFVPLIQNECLAKPLEKPTMLSFSKVKLEFFFPQISGLVITSIDQLVIQEPLIIDLQEAGHATDTRVCASKLERGESIRENLHHLEIRPTAAMSRQNEVRMAVERCVCRLMLNITSHHFTSIYCALHHFICLC